MVIELIPACCPKSSGIASSLFVVCSNMYQLVASMDRLLFRTVFPVKIGKIFIGFSTEKNISTVMEFLNEIDIGNILYFTR